MLIVYWDGNVEYFSLWYYFGCLKYWLRVLKLIDVIGMYVGIRLSILFIYRVFWCNFVGGELIKYGLKIYFYLLLYYDRKYKLLFWKYGFLRKCGFYFFWSYFINVRRKEFRGGRGK